MLRRTPECFADETDLKLLAMLQRNNLAPLRVMAKAVHLSAPAVQRRIKRLRAAGFIRADVALLDPQVIGQYIMLIVEVRLENERVGMVELARKSFNAAPEVQQCYYVTGRADFILIVFVSSMEEYEAFTHRLSLQNKNITHFETFVSMERIKVGMTIPLQQEFV